MSNFSLPTADGWSRMTPWKSGWVHCHSCHHRWVAAFPAAAGKGPFECPNCRGRDDQTGRKKTGYLLDSSRHTLTVWLGQGYVVRDQLGCYLDSSDRFVPDLLRARHFDDQDTARDIAAWALARIGFPEPPGPALILPGLGRSS